MAIVVHIVPHHGDGPLWPQKTWHEAEKCKNYWWTNLLFISNFIDAKYQVCFTKTLETVIIFFYTYLVHIISQNKRITENVINRHTCGNVTVSPD